VSRSAERRALEDINHVRDDDDDDDGGADDGDDDDATRGDDAGGVCAPGGAIGDVHVRGTTRTRARAHAGDDDRAPRARGGDRGSRGGDGGMCLCDLID
jgi:hypothetical protein